MLIYWSASQCRPQNAGNVTDFPQSCEPQIRPRAVFLVGFMGAGKTTVGQMLSARLGWQFLDLDTIIEAQAGKSIAEIFESSGEATFRQLETEALENLLDGISRGCAKVVALGGGAFAQARNIELLERSAFPVVFLDAPLDELRRRIGEDDTRPLFANAEHFRLLYEQRQAHYRRAAWRVQTDGKSVVEVAREIEFLIGEH
jgi:shikimate kinase